MAMGILDHLSALVSRGESKPKPGLAYRVVLGALLSLVAKADGQITEREKQAKREILARYHYSDPQEQDEILEASRQALEERLDWQGFTREVNQQCEYSERLRLLRELFAVAWADHDLSHSEQETIRKISNLLWIDHQDFIQAKLETKPAAEKK